MATAMEDPRKPNFICLLDIPRKARKLLRRYRQGRSHLVTTAFTLAVELNILIARNRNLRAVELVRDNMVSILHSTRSRDESLLGLDRPKIRNKELKPFEFSKNEIFIVFLTLVVLDFEILTNKNDQQEKSLDPSLNHSEIKLEFLKDESYGILLLCNLIDEVEDYVKEYVVKTFKKSVDFVDRGETSSIEESTTSSPTSEIVDVNDSIIVTQDELKKIYKHLQNIEDEEIEIEIDVESDENITTLPSIVRNASSVDSTLESSPSIYQADSIEDKSSATELDSSFEDLKSSASFEYMNQFTIGDHHDDSVVNKDDGIQDLSLQLRLPTQIQSSPILHSNSPNFDSETRTNSNSNTKYDNQQHILQKQPLLVYSKPKTLNFEPIKEQEEFLIELSNLRHNDIDSNDTYTTYNIDNSNNVDNYLSPNLSPIRLHSRDENRDIGAGSPLLTNSLSIKPPEPHFSPVRLKKLEVNKVIPEAFSLTGKLPEDEELKFAFKSENAPSYIKQDKKFKFIRVGKVQKLVNMFEEKVKEKSEASSRCGSPGK